MIYKCDFCSQEVSEEQASHYQPGVIHCSRCAADSIKALREKVDSLAKAIHKIGKTVGAALADDPVATGYWDAIDRKCKALVKAANTGDDKK